MNCDNCRTPIKCPRANQRFCSDSCRAGAWRKVHTPRCPTCGTTISVRIIEDRLGGRRMVQRRQDSVDGRNHKTYAGGGQLHRAVWENQHGPIPSGVVIHHIDGNKHNNRLDNLAAVSIAAHSRMHAAARRGLPTKPILGRSERREEVATHECD